MALRIRLKKIGSTNRPMWRIVVSDSKMPRDGRFIEEIGFYNPLPVREEFRVKEDRLEYWLGKGARMTDSMATLLKRNRKQPKVAS